jgi:hypothetical protein
MGIFADKLREKSYPAAEARLAVLASEALRDANKNMVVAAGLLNKKLQNDFWVLKDLFLLPVSTKEGEAAPKRKLCEQASYFL